ncbi:hypothetical protein [Gluconobacter oxydans]|uniref:Uncharacterized protein n=1 Tax=Gluconobacter oxydans TaxID=442 RepID=A0A149RXU1_GLUOY|nr:hypothetical protein [Gluconobacter oxydans]KXV19239.1 hypothetical protein AD934_05330 [Gluconobacter oxydans]WKE49659.1 hypothetical protein NUJ38_14110 [Gluconobacter oxydans]
MADHSIPHAASSIHDLGRKAAHTPDLLTDAERIRLAKHVLKEGERPTDEEQQIAQEILKDPQSVDAPQIGKLGHKTLARH